MATKPRVPAYTVPPVGPGGLMDKDWFAALSRQQHSGDVDATPGAAGPAMALPATPEGYITIYVNGTGYLVPFYAKP